MLFRSLKKRDSLFAFTPSDFSVVLSFFFCIFEKSTYGTFPPSMYVVSFSERHALSLSPHLFTICSNVHKLSDLKGKRLIVQSDSSALAALTGDDATKENKKLAASLKDLQQVADYNSAFMNLESGMVEIRRQTQL